jgi:hypothetical protein
LEQQFGLAALTKLVDIVPWAIGLGTGGINTKAHGQTKGRCSGGTCHLETVQTGSRAGRYEKSQQQVTRYQYTQALEICYFVTDLVRLGMGR